MREPGSDPTRIGFLASHRGTNMQAIIDACRDGRLRALPAVAISDNPECAALERARQAGVPARLLHGPEFRDPGRLDRAILETLRDHRVDLVVLAGYMKRIGPATLAAYPGRILNVHPALLPAHGGRGMYGGRVHAAVLAAGDAESGATVHVVDEEYDHGPILAQRRVPVRPGDTVESLAARVLPVEHELYVETLAKIVRGEIRLDGRRETEGG